MCFTLPCWMRSFTARRRFGSARWIYAVADIEQIDDIGLEALERCPRRPLDVFWTTVLGSTNACQAVHPLDQACNRTGGDHHLARKWSQRFAHEFFRL